MNMIKEQYKGQWRELGVLGLRRLKQDISTICIWEFEIMRKIPGDDTGDVSGEVSGCVVYSPPEPPDPRALSCSVNT